MDPGRPSASTTRALAAFVLLCALVALGGRAAGLDPDLLAVALVVCSVVLTGVLVRRRDDR